MEELKFNENGLIPAIVQDAKTNQVLMMAYMNKESLEISIKEQRTCFWSRSRQELWRKGETSGNVQEIVSISSDCDQDTLLIKVNPKGPACHTGAGSCFYNEMVGTSEDTFSMQELYELIKGRKTNPQEGSYTTYLFQKGDDKILKKIGEESTEVVIAAKNQDNQEIIFEVSDLIYHLMVLLAEKGIGLDEIYKELGNRHVVDKKVKQETMQ